MSEATPTLDLSKYIENRLMSGRAHIVNRRIPVWMIGPLVLDRKLTEVLEDFEITAEEALACALYYLEHRAEIDALVEEDIRLHEEGAVKTRAHFAERRAKLNAEKSRP